VASFLVGLFEILQFFIVSISGLFLSSLFFFRITSDVLIFLMCSFQCTIEESDFSENRMRRMLAFVSILFFRKTLSERQWPKDRRSWGSLFTEVW